MQTRIGTGMGLAQLAQTTAQGLRRAGAALAQGWRRLLGEPYRPEKHYMRGPGPKWHAKHAKQAQAMAGLPEAREEIARGR